MKNLHPRISGDDLRAIFGHFRSQGSEGEEEWPKIRIMTGRMKGQAFVEFASESLQCSVLQAHPLFSSKFGIGHSYMVYRPAMHYKHTPLLRCMGDHPWAYNT